MGSVNPVRGQEEPLCVDIGFYDTGYPSITLRDEQGDRCLTVDYRGYVPNLHIAVPRRSNTDIELLREKGVIRSCNPVKTDFQGGEPVGVFPLTRRCVLEVFSAVTDHYSRVPHVDIDLVSLEGCSVRGPFRVSYQEQLRNSAAADTVNTEAPTKGYGEISILEYALEKAQERWGSSSDIGILIAQDGDNQERTNLAWCAQKNLYTLIIEELTTRYGFEIEGQYFFEDDWNALKRMIRQGKVPSIRLRDGTWEIKYYESPLGCQDPNYHDWYYGYDFLGLHQVEKLRDDQSQPDTGKIEFKLLTKKSGILPRINQNHSEHDTVSKFTIRNGREHPRSILEYAVQCGRNIGLPPNNIRIVMSETAKDSSIISNDILREIVKELKEQHGFTAPVIEHKSKPLECLREMIDANKNTPIILPSGKWVPAFMEETHSERRVKNGMIQGIHARYHFLELVPSKQCDE